MAANHPSGEPVYSEADMAIERLMWERRAQEQSFNVQIAQITGTLAALPSQMEATARKVFADMFERQQRELSVTRARKWSHAESISMAIQTAMAIAIAYLAFKGLK